MKKKVLIVVADYYKNISSGLINSAKKEIQNFFSIRVIRVPGVFEIPVMISKNINKFDGFIALGCVIKGKTPHFDFISSATTDGIMKLSIENKKPVGNGIITCLNMNQAIKRKTKGAEASKAVKSILLK
tara:strand:- start:80 stop:466 length:387 start_codon:yes stop_codon:yes gene_type:complete